MTYEEAEKLILTTFPKECEQGYRFSLSIQGGGACGSEPESFRPNYWFSVGDSQRNTWMSGSGNNIAEAVQNLLRQKPQPASEVIAEIQGNG